MAGTVTPTDYAAPSFAVKKLKFVWVSDGSGNADGSSLEAYFGQVLALVTIPAAAGSAPSDNYDITVTDVEGYDVMQGAGANRDTANTETAVPTATSAAFGQLTLNVSNAGSSKGGTAILYIK